MDLKCLRQDWWVGYTSDLLPLLKGVPGINIRRDGKMEIHRSHLPLLGIPQLEYQSSLDSRNKADVLSSVKIENSWKLRGYQHTGRDFILSRRGTLLADIQRSGKTVEIVSSYFGKGRLLIAAPLAVRPVWFRWIDTVHPGIKSVYVTSRTYDQEQFKGADAIFCNYDILGDWTSFGATKNRFELVVLDEAHLLSNSDSKRSKGALGAAMAAERVVAATATPLWNHPAGLYGIFNCINPKGWGTWPEHTIRYSNAGPGEFGWKLGEPSKDAKEEFQDRLTEVMIRRHWKDILSELPNINRSVEIVDISKKDRIELDRHLNGLISDAKGRVPQIGLDARLRRLLGALKIKTAIGVAKRFLEAKEDVVVWTWHKELAREVGNGVFKAGFSVYVGTGDDDLEVALESWRVSLEPSALVLTIGVGQVGIDLSRARHCVFAEVDYTPAMISQAEMRTFLERRPMTVTYVLADHELDYRLVKTILKKCADAYDLGTPTTEADLDIFREAFLMDKPDLKAVVEGL